MLSDRAAWQLLRANRHFVTRVARHDLALIAAGLAWIAAPSGDLRMTVSSGVFAALVLMAFAAMQVEVVRRSAPDLRNLLVLPVRRESLLAVFYAGFMAPGLALLLVLGGTAALLAGRSDPHGTAGAAARLADAIVGFLFFKSLVVNFAVAIRWNVVLVGFYLVFLVAVYFLLLAFAEFLGFPAIPGRAMAALLAASNVAVTLGVARELDF